jgi:hypothetical protein
MMMSSPRTTTIADLTACLCTTAAADITLAAEAQGVQPNVSTHIFENMDARASPRFGVHDLMFVLGQAPVKGAVPVTINPIAIG